MKAHFASSIISIHFILTTFQLTQISLETINSSGGMIEIDCVSLMWVFVHNSLVKLDTRGIKFLNNSRKYVFHSTVNLLLTKLLCSTEAFITNDNYLHKPSECGSELFMNQ